MVALSEAPGGNFAEDEGRVGLVAPARIRAGGGWTCRLSPISPSWYPESPDGMLVGEADNEEDAERSSL